MLLACTLGAICYSTGILVGYYAQSWSFEQQNYCMHSRMHVFSLF
jgi:hypothetical protein